VIGHLRGIVGHREPGTVIVDVHGVGYLVHVRTTEDVPARGQPLELHTTLHVREDALTLYGFGERTTLALFGLLVSSSGVGPRLALAALSTHPPAVLRSAIATGDLATLTEVPGIGRKVAERLVLELKDKVGAPVADTAEGRSTPAHGTDEVRDALVGLGYRSAEIADALDEIATDDETDSAELLRRALRHLGGRAAREVAR
jgi:holliday junction DNA helicase RuvA